MSRHVYCYHYNTCTKPGQWVVMCIVTITLSVQSHENERSCVLLPLHDLYKSRTMSGHVYCYHYTTCTTPGKWAIMCIVTITLPAQSQDNERSCVLLPLHYLYKAMKMSGHVCCYLYTTCTKPGKWAVMCIVTITLPVQSQDNERSYVLLPLHYLYKARTMSGNVYCYHYATCSKPGQWAVMRIVTITLPVQSQGNEWSCVLLPLSLSVQSHENERSCVLLPLHYLFKARTMSVMCIVTITLSVQSHENERSCVLLPLHYLYKARKMSGHVYCYHYTTGIKQVKWAVMCIVTITLPVLSQDNERSCLLLPLHYLYKAR